MTHRPVADFSFLHPAFDIRYLTSDSSPMPIHDQWIVLDDPTGLPDPSSGSPITRAMLGRREVIDSEALRLFLEPNLDDLHDPWLIAGMAHACDRISRAIRDQESILIYGDYDVDGVTSIVLLTTVLRRLGAVVAHVVPHRLYDGYGLKIEVIERVLTERKVGLVITVDCGITSVEPVQKAIEMGIDVIITDHHLPPGILPEAAAVLNPKVDGCEYPYKDLAGVGVAFKLCCALLQKSGSTMSIHSLLKIAAIGTIADVAPLTGENRTIALLGLRGLSDVRNPGLRALLSVNGLGNRPLRSQDVGFKIGPRINAAGRLASADTAIDLFGAASQADALPIVLELNRLNHLRQTIEKEVLSAAEEQVVPSDQILIVAGEGWHKGVLGLCASRIANRYHRPTLVASINGQQVVGSGRSVRAVNLHELLSGVADLFEHFGGHDYACGFSFPLENLEPIRERLKALTSDRYPDRLVRSLDIESLVSLGDISATFFAEHQQMEPFGAGNLQPVFVARNVRVERIREFSASCFELQLRENDHRLRAVLWPSLVRLGLHVSEGDCLDIAFQLEPDHFRQEGYRASIVDLAPAGGAPFAERKQQASCSSH
ncbi:MAG TPA: single-stranded-DNA-specific exonuclease RecJ [Thermoanaerobaculia bacterium]|nr:single-stranded-DNA-specific exonuclease RecJ [Thermoanaerobaculia bacterium]